MELMEVLQTVFKAKYLKWNLWNYFKQFLKQVLETEILQNRTYSKIFEMEKWTKSKKYLKQKYLKRGILETEVIADLRLNLCRNFGLEKMKDSCVVNRGYPSMEKSTDRSGLIVDVVGSRSTLAPETTDAFRMFFAVDICGALSAADEGPDCPGSVTVCRLGFIWSALCEAISFYKFCKSQNLLIK